ncbi:MAG: patatin-like phospholipase family protein [Bacteroidota bacterium]
MTPKDLCQSPEILAILEQVRQYDESVGGLVISDTIDGLGHQYVDLVQEGGGVWGISLLGYTYVLEQMGIRFMNLGGTSAGAINTLLMAAAARPEEEKTMKLLEILLSKNLSEFIDGNWRVKKLVKAINRKASTLTLLFWGFMNMGNLKRNWGLNPGRHFQKWLESTLDKFGIQTTEDLLARMNNFPDSIQFRDPSIYPKSHLKSRLAIIAADLTTRTKVEFPEMAALYFRNPKTLNPAQYARASMSIPIFFTPVLAHELEKDPQTWSDLAEYHGPIPSAAVLVDGGIMSNFPIDAFHLSHGIPSRPTLGIKLGLGRKAPPKVQGYTDVAAACFTAARNIRDQQFITDNPDYRRLVSSIDTTGYDWMNFDVSDDTKRALFVRGAQAARDFLLEFDWQAYKKIRREREVKNLKGAASALALDAGELMHNIQTAIRLRGQVQTDHGGTSLERRMRTIHERGVKFKVLWVVDDPEDNTWEIRVLREIGVTLHLEKGDDDAYAALQNNVYDLMLSDIRRDGNAIAGLEFLQRLHTEGRAIPTIFYIENLDRSLGTPAYALAITNHPEEFIHLVLDRIERVQ